MDDMDEVRMNDMGMTSKKPNWMVAVFLLWFREPEWEEENEWDLAWMSRMMNKTVNMMNNVTVTEKNTINIEDLNDVVTVNARVWLENKLSEFTQADKTIKQ